MIGRFWSLVVGFVLAPYIISMIGIDRFGIWALLSILVGYFALLDLGIGTSFARFISEAYTKADYDEINRIANSGFLFYLCLTFPILCIAHFGRTPIFTFLNINPVLYPDSKTAYYGTLAIFLLTTAMSGFTLILHGIQKIDIVNKIAIAVSIPNALVTVLFLRSGMKLDGLMWTSMITSGCALTLSFYFAKKYVPALRFNPFLFATSTMRRLMGYGLKIQFAKFAEVLIFQADKTIVSYFSGVGAVGYYQVGSQIVWRTRDLPVLLLSSLLPAASELHTLNDRKKLIDIYVRGTKYLAAVSIPLLFLLAAVAHPLMRAWMGEGFAISADISQILTMGYLFNVLMGVGAAVAAGMNQPNFQWHSAIVSTILNFIFVIDFGYYFGTYGIAVASTFSLIIGSIYFVVKFHSYVQISLSPFFKSTLLHPFLAAVAGFAVVWIANRFSVGISPGGGRGPSVALLIGEGFLFLLVYLVLILRFAFFDEIDRELFYNNYLVSKARRILGRS